MTIMLCCGDANILAIGVLLVVDVLLLAERYCVACCEYYYYFQILVIIMILFASLFVMDVFTISLIVLIVSFVLLLC